MGEGLIETKRRIESINSTGKITSAMKLVASVKLKRWRTLFDNNTPYYLGYKKVMEKLLSCVTLKEAQTFTTTLFSYPDSKKRLYVLISSDLGLCGGYNFNIFRKLESVLNKEDEILFIGTKGYLHFRNCENKMYRDFEHLVDDFTYDNIKQFRHFLVRFYNLNKYKEVFLVYTKYINSLNFEPSIDQVLPLKHDELKAESSEIDNIIFENNAKDCIEKILPHYIDSYLYNKIIESVVCESAARRNAMENATKNAEEIIDDLKLKYNKARQARITQEITEVISGSVNIK